MEPTTAQVSVFCEQKSQGNDLACCLKHKDSDEHVVRLCQCHAHGGIWKTRSVGIHGQSDTVGQDDYQHGPIKKFPSDETDHGLSDEVVLLKNEQSLRGELIGANDL